MSDGNNPVCFLARSNVDQMSDLLEKLIPTSQPVFSNNRTSTCQNNKYSDYREHEGTDSTNSTGTEMVVLQEHQARSVFEISCPTGVPVQILSQEDPNLWKVKYQGRQGLVPSSCFTAAPGATGDQQSSVRSSRRAESRRRLASHPNTLSLPTVFESTAELRCRQALTPPPSRRTTFSWFLSTRRRSTPDNQAAMSTSKGPPVAPPRPAHTFSAAKSKQRVAMTRSADLPGHFPVERVYEGRVAPVVPHQEYQKAHTDASRSISLPAGLYLVTKQQNTPTSNNGRPPISRGAKAKAKLTRLFSPPSSTERKGHRPLPEPPVERMAGVRPSTLGTTCHIAGQRPNGQPIFAHRPAAGVAPERAGLRRMASWSGNGSISMVSKEALSQISHQQRRSIGCGSHQAPAQACGHCQCCREQKCASSPRHSREETTANCSFDSLDRRQPLARTCSTPNEFFDPSFSMQTVMARRKKRSFDNSVKYRAFEWFFGRMSRDRAELLLIKYGKDEDYLLRERELEQGTYAIAIRVTSTLVRHFRIFEGNHGYSCNPNSDRECPSLVDLVLYHEKFALCGAGAAKDSYFLYRPMERANIPASEGIPPVMDTSDLPSNAKSDYHNTSDGVWQNKNYVESNPTRPKTMPRSEANLSPSDGERSPREQLVRAAEHPQTVNGRLAAGDVSPTTTRAASMNGKTTVEIHGPATPTSPPRVVAAVTPSSSSSSPCQQGKLNHTPPIPEEEITTTTTASYGTSTATAMTSLPETGDRVEATPVLPLPEKEDETPDSSSTNLSTVEKNVSTFS